MSRESQDEFERLKELLIKIYFPKNYDGSARNTHLSLYYKDTKFLKLIKLPKRFYRSYFLKMNTGRLEFARQLPYREKDSVKYFINIINKPKNE